MADLFETIWKSAVLLIAGILVLRLAGRKSISQMTLAQTVVMISIGSIIIRPIVQTSIWRTVTAVTTFVLVLILLEWLQTKFDFLETFLSNKGKVVIENGKPVIKNLKQTRMTIDQLEMRLRQLGIEKISDVKTAVLEHNGQLGYELERHAKPLTVGEFEKLMGHFIQKQQGSENQNFNMFDEVIQNKHEPDIPDRLQ